MNFTKENPEAVIMTITPEIAQEMLNTSPGNRKMRGWYVQLLSATMRRGEWRVTNQGIGFNNRGELRDAHHRLTACIQSKVSFTSLVVMGLREDVYEVVDTGINRTYGDRLNIDRRAAEVLRLAGSYMTGTQKPTTDQLKPLIDGGLVNAIESLIEYCGATRRHYSSASMKLAAVVSIINGSSSDYVLSQYRALCLLDIDKMSTSSKTLFKQLSQSGGFTPRQLLAKGIKIFDDSNQDLLKLYTSDNDIESSIALVKSAIRSLSK